MKKFIVLTVLTCLVFLSFPFNLYSEEEREKTVNIAIIPWKVRAPEEFSYLKDALYDMISSRIAVERQIRMVSEASSKKVFSRFSDLELTDNLIREIGKELEADYVISGSLTLIGDTLSLDAMAVKVSGKEAPIHTVSQGKSAESLIPLIGRMALEFNEQILQREGLSATVSGFGRTPRYVGAFNASPEQQQPSSDNDGGDFLIVTRESSTQTKLWKSQTFATVITGMAVGDTNGNGNNEIVLIDQHNLWIYRKTSSTLEFISEFKNKRYSKNLTVDVGDLNNNGIDEIYITSWTGRNLDSYVVEYQDGQYREIASELNWFLRVLESPKRDNILIGQRTSGGQFFHGDVRKLIWKDNQLMDTKSLDMPAGLDIYGFIQIDFDGDDREDTISYDFSDRLVAYLNKINNSEWEKVWTSSDYFGGTVNKIEREISASKTSGDDNLPQASIKNRILQRDLDRDGEVEIILNKNITSKLGRYFDKSREYKKGEIVNLIWTGNSLEENWKTKTLEGYIADFQIDDIDNDGFKDLIIALVTQFGGVKTQPASHLVSYKLNVR